MTTPSSANLSADTIARALGLFTPTPAQRAVIEAPAEPALVVAGAGSGKTETMSARVLWLVANGHVRADQILGLTFTRKAAGELAERVARRLEQIDEFGRRGLLPHLAEIVESPEFARIAQADSPAQRAAIRGDVLDGFADRLGTMPAGAAGAEESLLNRPRVSTYNAFADSVVRDNAARIGRDPDAGMLSSSAAWTLARHVALRADGVGLEDTESGLGEIVRAIQNLSGALLDHRADPAAVRRYAEAQAREFEPFLNPALSSPRPWERAHAALSALPMLLDLVAEYTAEKQRRGVLDFADQVSGALDVVETAPDVAEALRQEFPVVLLDEYQDTSVLQTRFLAELFHDTAVMAVGDPNQAIYGWRGASADNIHGFARDFAREAPSHTFDLMTSWRNDRVVLEAANRLVRPLARAGSPAVARLEPRPGAGEGAIDVAYAETVDDEAAAVADWFVERRAAHEAAGGSDPHTGAILFRSKKHMQRFADALAARGVPHRILGLGGLMSVPEVTDVVCALRVIHDPSEGSALIRLLVGPRFAVGVADMGALHDLASELARRDESLAPLSDEVRARVRASAGLDEQVSIIDALDFIRTAPDGYRLLEGFTAEGRARLREAAEVFDRLRRAAGQPIPDLLRMIEQELRLDIELAANETRGPARTAAAQLRAFAEEVRGFLSVDERGTIGSVLAWLDYAEAADDLVPRSEPPEPGVVQLLTIHGSKGLEWDAVAVVRLVDGELPSGAKNVRGGFAFGELPYEFRGDAPALPRFEWSAPAVVPDAKAAKAEERVLKEAFETFAQQNREYQLDEERRLAYVAVTRARGALLLTGSHWSGQKKPRAVSTYLAEILDELGRDAIEERTSDDADPYDGVSATLEWPLDALGERAARVHDAARAVREAASAAPSPEVARLLAEREERDRGLRIEVPARVPASKFKDYVVGFDEALDELARPMPERPYRQTRLGTLFHRWVEERSGLVGAGSTPDEALWEIDDAEGEWSGQAAASAEDERDLARLREIFERSEWGPLQPIEVETEVDFALRLDPDAPPHIMICKLDAVYRRADRGGRIEIVDWKTGKAPRTDAEREDRLLQLALYRLAYHRRHGVPLDEIDVALFYVPDDLVLRDAEPIGERELVERWRRARGA